MSGRALDNLLFTAHVSNTCQDRDGWRPNPTYFTCPPQMREAIKRAIEKAPTRKAAGIDEVKTEMLKVDTEMSTNLLYEIWDACGRCGGLPSSWMKALLVPIYKKGDQDDPKNHRPISLLSQARKIIESALDCQFRNIYSNNPMQLGFQKGKSTEGAILRATELQHRGQRSIAVLDLTAAYDSVPRIHIRERVRKFLPKTLSDMIEAFLAPAWISTLGDTQERWFVVDRGVPQGSPLSPSLYNIFMDEFAERLNGVSREVADVPAVLFADDVLLTAKSATGLQELLDIASKWGEDRQMKWNVNAGKSEVLESEETKHRTFLLAGRNLGKTPEVTYLGVSLSSEGVTDSKTVERARKAKTAVYQLRSLGVSPKGIHIEKSIRIYKCLIQPRWEYAMHLVPWTPRIQQAIEDTEKTFFAQVFGNIGRKRSKRLRLLCRIDSAEHRRKILALRMLERATERKERILAEPPLTRNVGELQWACRDIAAMLRRETI